MVLYVGIDVSKNKHDLAYLDSEGEIVLKNFRFQNTYQGFQTLKECLEILDSDPRKLHIALEDTGHYAHNLVHFLQTLNYPVFTYNPLFIKEFVKSQTLRKTKTDKKDALTIARKLRSDNVSERYRTDETLDELKELTRYPSTQKIGRAHFDSLLKINRLIAKKATDIQKATRLIIDTSSAALQIELTQLISTIRHLASQIYEIQAQIDQLLELISSPILSISGISHRLGAIILAEIRDIHNFKSPAQLLAFAGLEPAIYQSGQMDNRGHMFKHGSSYLRYALIQAAKLAAVFSPHFKAYLVLKRSQGKHCNIAVTHVAKKLVRVIYTLLQTNQKFDEAKLR